ncbi:MAG: CPBP family intramembrane metalloprotease [Anaerolineae bacterium]|nr:CPBP family intramembrane metalloprotease [Anaerolineae bacterium]
MAAISRTESRNLGLFFLIAFAWSWLFLLPRVLVTAGWFALPGWLSFFLSTVAAFGPFIAAFALTYWNEGQEGVSSLWRRGWEYRFQKKWLAPTLLLPPVVAVLTVLVIMLAGENINWELAPPMLTLFPVFMLIFFTNAFPEEFGWRGYVLDRFQLRWNALISSLILGGIWGLWQLPLHFVAGTTQHTVPIWEFVAQTIVVTIAYTWLYNNTGGSILMAMLFHAVSSFTAAVIPYWTSATGRWIHLAILLVVVGAIVLTWGPKTLVRKTKAPASPPDVENPK